VEAAGGAGRTEFAGGLATVAGTFAASLAGFAAIVGADRDGCGSALGAAAFSRSNSSGVATTGGAGGTSTAVATVDVPPPSASATVTPCFGADGGGWSTILVAGWFACDLGEKRVKTNENPVTKPSTATDPTRISRLHCASSKNPPFIGPGVSGISGSDVAMSLIRGGSGIALAFCGCEASSPPTRGLSLSGADMPLGSYLSGDCELGNRFVLA
jgi:hypothetical protein